MLVGHTEVLLLKHNFELKLINECLSFTDIFSQGNAEHLSTYIKRYLVDRYIQFVLPHTEVIL